MIKLVEASKRSGTVIRLRFSDGSWGDFDFSVFIQADTPMTRPLAEDKFFQQFFIEAGALAWPNGFDLSAASLQMRLAELGQLHRDVQAA